MRHYCTLFDRNFLYKGVALLRSLERHAGDFTLHVLCLDEVTYETLGRLRLERVRRLRLPELENEELRQIKATRTPLEYYWTLTPSLPLWVLEHEPAADGAIYLDADLYFYASPEGIFREIGAGSIGIHEHRFPPRRRHLEREVGRFNVGWVSFRRDAAGLACLRDWRSRCNEWCFYRAEEGKLGDQMYLDAWPDQFHGVHVIRQKGAGLGPWNIEQYSLRRTPTGSVSVDEDPLVFHHFHRLKLHEDGGYTLDGDYAIRRSEERLVYGPYLAEIRAAIASVRAVAPEFRHGLVPRDPPPPFTRRVRRAAGRLLRALRLRR